MLNGISKTFEGIIARTAFDTAKAGIEHALKDHLLLEMLRTDGSLASQLLSANLPQPLLARIVMRIEETVAAGVNDAPRRPADFYGDYLRELALRYAGQHISTLHALYDILSDTSTVSSRLFAEHGFSAVTVLAEIRSRLEAARKIPSAEIRIMPADDGDRDADIGFRPASSAAEGSLLAKFGTDLTRLAREGKIDPVVGREEEIARVIQVLSRRKKNNPVLIGDAGVGKSAIVEGLALRMAAGDVPPTIRDKRLFALDIAALVAGTKFRGEFEERMQQILDDLRRTGDTIIFIDEIHTIVGAGSSQGSLDTANILKPALARGEIQTIGATTPDEYRQNIEKDAALERRFQRVAVEPTTREQTLQILKNIAPDYERHHNVRYTAEALQACVDLTERYIADRRFPDKAIDIMDEAGSRAHLTSVGEPEELKELETALAVAESERREAVASLTYDRAASARMREIALRSRIGECRAEWQRRREMNPATVDADSIAAVITSVTGIPAERIAGGERERLRTLREELSARVVGQQEAVDRVAKSIVRSRSGLKPAGRPVGVFMFVGPTGVGKTLLAKELSNLLFDGGRGLIRVDMSEYGEKHNVSRLIGSPPGYVGYGEGGQLTEAVRRHPYSVVLFDEIEKAHPDVFNAMLQIFDEGHLTDGSGRLVDFRNTVIIMTSNVGSQEVAARPPQVGYATASKRTVEAQSESDGYRRALERTFAPEFLNRIDDVVVFRRLDVADVERIIDIELRDVAARAGKLGYGLRITEGARRCLADMGYEQRYGARALHRTITDEVEEPLAALIVEGKLKDGATVVIEKSRHKGIALKVA